MMTPEAGSAGFAARLVGGRSAAVSLRPGSHITLHSTLSPLTGRLELVGSNMRLAPVGPVDITPGKRIRLLVLATTPQVRLKLLPDGSAAHRSDSSSFPSSVRHVLSALGMHRDDGAGEIIRALLSSQRELSPDLIRTLALRIDRDLPDRSRQRRGRALVEIADKNIDLDSESLQADDLLAIFTDGRWSGGSGPYSREKPDASSHDTSAATLRSFLTRTTEQPSHGLQLFNYLRGSGPLHWVVIPIGARQGTSSTTGTLRVGIDTAGSAVEATLGLDVGNGMWWFSWELSDGRAQLVSWEQDDGAPAIPKSLLARITGRGHTNRKWHQNGDGFSGRSPEIHKLGVDEYG